MSDSSGFHKEVTRYLRRVRRTMEELARELPMSKGELSKCLNEYHHPKTRRTWRLRDEDVFIIVQTLAKWGAITAQEQAVSLLEMMRYSRLDSIDWKTGPFSKLRPNSTSRSSSDTKLQAQGLARLQAMLGNDGLIHSLIESFVGR